MLLHHNKNRRFAVMKHVDALVIGQGISGTLTANALEHAGLNVLVADAGIYPVSSQVAAGLVHPLLPKTGGLTWRAEEIFPAVQAFYQSIEAAEGRRFFHPMPMAFVADTDQERQHWKRAAERLGSGWLEWHEALPQMPARAGAITRLAGRLDMAALCTHFQQKWLDSGSYIRSKFLWEDASFDGTNWCWKDVKARLLVLCQGVHARNEMPLDVLPFHPTKGELCTIRITDSCSMPDYIVKKKVFSIPLGNSLFRVGATYQWDQLNPIPTEEGKEELIRQFHRLFPDVGEFEIVHHEAAVRPTVGRRRPFMGKHPKYRNVFISNGWGSKGASLAAVLIPDLVSSMLHGTPVHPETSLDFYWQ